MKYMEYLDTILEGSYFSPNVIKLANPDYDEKSKELNRIRRLKNDKYEQGVAKSEEIRTARDEIDQGYGEEMLVPHYDYDLEKYDLGVLDLDKNILNHDPHYNFPDYVDSPIDVWMYLFMKEITKPENSAGRLELAKKIMSLDPKDGATLIQFFTNLTEWINKHPQWSNELFDALPRVIRNAIAYAYHPYVNNPTNDNEGIIRANRFTKLHKALIDYLDRDKLKGETANEVLIREITISEFLEDVFGVYYLPYQYNIETLDI